MNSKKPKLKFKKLREFDFNNKNYRIIWRNKRFPGNHCAETEDPKCDNPQIRIAPKSWKNGSECLLSVLCDEIIHTHVFSLDNSAVNDLSNDLAKFLTLVGYHLDERILLEKK